MAVKATGQGTDDIRSRKFLKSVGVSSQRVIEQAVDRAKADGIIYHPGHRIISCHGDAGGRRPSAECQVRWRDQAPMETVKGEIEATPRHIDRAIYELSE